MESTCNLVELPKDLILDILLRLRVKTLLQLKCVCKRLKSLIESPYFVNRHFLHESNHEYLFLRHYRPDEKKHAFVLYSDETLSRYDESEHLQMPSRVSDLLGPLNGVFCVVSTSAKMGLLNPSMRWFKPLHFVRPPYPKHITPYDHLFGFGIDPESQSYKLVLIQHFWDEETDEPHSSSMVSIYNSGSDSWRHVEDVDFFGSGRAYPNSSLCNTYMNGAYYWYADSDDGGGGVVVFDMSSDLFREVKAPQGVENGEVDLARYGDSIALLSCDSSRHIDVWVMETEGCWNKILRVGPLADMILPLGFWNKSGLLYAAEASELMIHDVRTRKSRTLRAGGKENKFFLYWVFSYKESLVSLSLDDGQRNDCYCWDPSSSLVEQLLS